MSSHPFVRLRQVAYDQIQGRGIEIGAFEHPANLPPSCQVWYCDAVLPEQAQELFPEISTAGFKDIDYLINLDTEGLQIFPNESLDFVIMCHVIEHVVNPINVIKETLRVLRPGGALVIAAPDRDYTFDRNRPLTPFDHVLADYKAGATHATLDDYMDIPRYVFPDFINLPPEELREHLEGCLRRREHLHIWTSASFRDFLKRSFTLLGEQPKLIYEVDGAQSQIEYFSLWRRETPSGIAGLLARARASLGLRPALPPPRRAG